MCSHLSRRGLTLVEVVAALGLLAGLMITMLSALAAHARGVGNARLRLDAIELSDQLLSAWVVSDGGIPVPAHGTFPGRDDLSWETTIADKSLRRNLTIDVVRFEVRLTHLPRREIPIFFVQLFVPAPTISTIPAASTETKGNS